MKHTKPTNLDKTFYPPKFACNYFSFSVIVYFHHTASLASTFCEHNEYRNEFDNHFCYKN
jgi:hypothetical protein